MPILTIPPFMQGRIWEPDAADLECTRCGEGVFVPFNADEATWVAEIQKALAPHFTCELPKFTIVLA